MDFSIRNVRKCQVSYRTLRQINWWANLFPISLHSWFLFLRVLGSKPRNGLASLISTKEFVIVWDKLVVVSQQTTKNMNSGRFSSGFIMKEEEVSIACAILSFWLYWYIAECDSWEECLMRMRERKFLKLDDCLDSFFFFFFYNHWTHDSSLEILGPILLAQKTFFF